MARNFHCYDILSSKFNEHCGNNINSFLMFAETGRNPYPVEKCRRFVSHFSEVENQILPLKVGWNFQMQSAPHGIMKVIASSL